MLFTRDQDGPLKNNGTKKSGFPTSTMVNYELNVNADKATYMMDIKDQANLRFNKDKRRLSSDDQGKVSDGRGASAASRGDVQPQDI
jgi:hypothetical protein